jgi:hypothetical protein
MTGMNHEELMARLERERVSYPDDLEAERYMPGAVERIAGMPVQYTPIGEDAAARNLARLTGALTMPTGMPTNTPTNKEGQ